MKKLITSLALIILTSFVLFGCSKGGFTFTDASLSLSDGTEITQNTHNEITDGTLYSCALAHGEQIKTKGDFATAEGIKIGSTVKDFIKAYGVTKDFGMWETYIKKSNLETIVNYVSFAGKELSASTYDDLFLTIGYVNDEKTGWRTLSFNELQAIWECSVGEDGYENEDLVLISAGFDKDGVITELIIDRGDYASFSGYYTAIDETLAK